MSSIYDRVLLATSVVIDSLAESVAAHAASAAVSTVMLAELAHGLPRPISW